MSAGIAVREATAGDRDAIARFNAAMALETEGHALDLAVVTRGVERGLADKAKGLYLVAERAGEVVGCLFVTREWSDWRDAWYWWIQSVYVAPEARGCGAYTALHTCVRDAARAEGGVVAIRLYVERDNRRAQSTYRKLGMDDTGYLVYEERL